MAQSGMRRSEYIQMKAFARIDGALLSAAWTASFACYIAGLVNPLLMMAGTAIGIGSLPYAGMRVRRFRDNVRDGELSFGRAYGYSTLMFFHAALLFAVAQFVYFQFIDHGFVLNTVTQMADTLKADPAMNVPGFGKMLDDSLRQMAVTRPIDYAMSYFTLNVMMGLVVGLPIAGLVRKAKAQ